jgi:hypothetical protein
MRRAEGHLEKRGASCAGPKLRIADEWSREEGRKEAKNADHLIKQAR